MHNNGLNDYQKVYQACIEAVIQCMRVKSEYLQPDAMLGDPKRCCSFFAVDLEQNTIKNIVPYLRRHHKKMGLAPVHNPGEYARYMFTMPSFRAKLMDSALKKGNKC